MRLGDYRKANIEAMTMGNNSTDTSGLSNASYIILFITFSFITTITVGGNVLVLLSIQRYQHLMKGVLSVFISSLACADLLIGTVEMPLAAMQIIEGSTWPFGRQACKFKFIIDVTSITASINSLCVIAFDRYIAITMPLRYPSLVTRRRASYAVLAVWIVSLTLSFFPIQFNWYRSKQPEALARYENPTSCNIIPTIEYVIISNILSFHLPAVLMILVYSRVLKEANRQVSWNVSREAPAVVREHVHIPAALGTSLPSLEYPGGSALLASR
uniref:beta-2 adrenergic receptor-like n=1 Tax=Myxine glutinosa TaxID=7769 RepID=UPI00358E7198